MALTTKHLATLESILMSLRYNEKSIQTYYDLGCCQTTNLLSTFNIDMDR